jgi:hypothetical protein
MFAEHFSSFDISIETDFQMVPFHFPAACRVPLKMKELSGGFRSDRHVTPNGVPKGLRAFDPLKLKG